MYGGETEALVEELTEVAVAPAAAGVETARAETTWEAPWTAGSFLRVEDLVGSITVDVAKDPGRVRIEARVVAEAEQAARALGPRGDVLLGLAGLVADRAGITPV